VTSAVTALVFANVAYWLAGIGAFFALGFGDARRSTWGRIPAAYLFGVALVVVPSSYLALLGVSIGWTTITVVTVALFAIGSLRSRRAQPTRPDAATPPKRTRTTADWVRTAVAGLFLCVVGFVFVRAAQTFVVTPLYISDAWHLWAAKARLLYELPSDAPAVLRQTNYGSPSYPLAMPELEALGFRSIGRFDGTLIDIQFLALAAGLVGTLWSFSRGIARSWLVMLTALALITAPQFLDQLGTSFVDIPLAIFVGSALLAGARWLSLDESDWWSLTCFAAFAGMAGLAKNEGTMFALAAIISLTVCARMTPGRRVRDVGIAAAGVAAIVLPWRIYGAAYQLPTADYDLKKLFNPVYLADHADRVRPVVTELSSELSDNGRWGHLLPIVALALIAGVLSRRWTIGLFAALWVLLAFAGLTMTYWVSVLPLTNNIFNSSYRTVDSIIIGAICLAPILVNEALTSITRLIQRISTRTRTTVAS
jgi:hypothetical protein